jgi:hypothetical protein
MRFQFVMVVWGDEFVRLMCKVCIPCLLARDNLPAIPANERFRFVFVTRASEVARLKNEPMVQRIERLVPVEFLEFDPTQYSSVHLALAGAHRMALVMAAENSAHAVMLGPDVVFSNNTLASVRRVAATGKSAIMVSGLRIATEQALPKFCSQRISETYSSNEMLAPRNLMKFAMENFHPEVARYYFDSPYFTSWPLVCLWQVGNEGVLDRSFHLHPLVLDMANCRLEALSTLDYDTIDGAFVAHGFPDWKKIYVEGDSDNMLVFSLSSIEDCAEPVRQNKSSAKLLRQTAYLFNVNALHRSFFKQAIRLHVGDLNDRWTEFEESTAVLSRGFRSFEERFPFIPRPLLRVLKWAGSRGHPVLYGQRSIFRRIMYIRLIFRASWQSRRTIVIRLKQCASEPEARARVRWRLRQVVSLVVFARWLPELPDKLSGHATSGDGDARATERLDGSK